MIALLKECQVKDRATQGCGPWHPLPLQVIGNKRGNEEEETCATCVWKISTVLVSQVKGEQRDHASHSLGCPLSYRLSLCSRPTRTAYMIGGLDPMGFEAEDNYLEVERSKAASQSSTLSRGRRTAVVGDGGDGPVGDSVSIYCVVAVEGGERRLSLLCRRRGGWGQRTAVGGDRA
nr:hypothetical protein Iba_chr15bCG9420 [Ipomoea batatas]